MVPVSAWRYTCNFLRETFQENSGGKRGKFETVEREKEKASSDEEGSSRRRLIARRLGRVESRQPGARTRRNSSGFRQAGRVVCRLVALGVTRIDYRPINERAHARLLEIDSLGFPPVPRSLATGCARSFNSCTPPENRFHECKSPHHRPQTKAKVNGVRARIRCIVVSPATLRSPSSCFFLNEQEIHIETGKFTLYTPPF